eukprot:gene9443-3278_t
MSRLRLPRIHSDRGSPGRADGPGDHKSKKLNRSAPGTMTEEEAVTALSGVMQSLDIRTLRSKNSNLNIAVLDFLRAVSRGEPHTFSADIPADHWSLILSVGEICRTVRSNDDTHNLSLQVLECVSDGREEDKGTTYEKRYLLNDGVWKVWCRSLSMFWPMMDAAAKVKGVVYVDVRYMPMAHELILLDVVDDTSGFDSHGAELGFPELFAESSYNPEPVHFVPSMRCGGGCACAPVEDRAGFTSVADVASVARNTCVLRLFPPPAYEANGVGDAPRGGGACTKASCIRYSNQRD